MFSSVIVVLLVACTSAQRITYGGCPDVSVKTPFDVTKYTGVWYEIEKNPVPFESGLKCNMATYEDKGDYFSVFNKGINEKTGKEQSVEGKATIPDKNVPAKLKVKFDMPFQADYWIIDTDYKSYSLVYSCFSVLRLFNVEYVWILSRDKTLLDATKQNLYNLMDKNGIKKDSLKQTVQDCA